MPTLSDLGVFDISCQSFMQRNEGLTMPDKFNFNEIVIKAIQSS